MLDEDGEFNISDEFKEVRVNVIVEAEALKLESSKLEDTNLQLKFNRKLIDDELNNVVAEHLRFQITRVFRVVGNENPVKMDRDTANNKGLAEAKDLTLAEVKSIYAKEKNNNNKEDQGGWGAKFNGDKLEVTQDENGLVTIKVLNDLFTHDDLTNSEKINSGNAKDQTKGYKITVYVDKDEYKIQLNAVETEGPVIGKFVEK